MRFQPDVDEANRKAQRRKTILFMLLCIAVITGILLYSGEDSTPMPGSKLLSSGIATNSSYQVNKSITARAAPSELTQVDDLKTNFSQANSAQGKSSSKELDHKLYSNAFLLTHSKVKSDIVDYCMNHTVSTNNALVNCNAAFRSDNLWYQIKEWSSFVTKVLFSAFGSWALLVLLVLVIGIIKIWSFIGWLFNLRGNSRKGTAHSAASTSMAKGNINSNWD